MPVFADLLPEADLPVSLDWFSSIDPTSLSDLWFNTWMTPFTRCLYGVLMVWGIICLWKMFKKAWLPWWGSIIPFYNIVLWFKMAWRSWRRTLSLLCPPLFAIMIIITYFDIAKRFGKGVGFWFGLWFLWPIFTWILAFWKAQYQHK